MKYEDYSNLPDSMTVDETKSLFIALLEQSVDLLPKDKIRALRAMDQLSDRQWHTYTILDSKLRQQIEDWISINWQKESIESTELVCTIIAKLGLRGCIKLLYDALKEDLKENIKKEIMESLKEYEEQVDDPYSGMRGR